MDEAQGAAEGVARAGGRGEEAVGEAGQALVRTGGSAAEETRRALPGTPGVVDDAAEAAARALPGVPGVADDAAGYADEAGEVARHAGYVIPPSRAVVPYGEYGTVLKATPADAESIRAFGRVAEEWQAARGQRSFGSLYWETVARRLEMGLTDEWFVHYSGSSVTGVMKVVSRTDILEIKTLEALGGGSGTRLMRAAVTESITRGFGGKVQLHAAPQAILFYQKLGPSLFNPIIENLFIWDEGAARFLLHNFR